MQHEEKLQIHSIDFYYIFTIPHGINKALSKYPIANGVYEYTGAGNSILFHSNQITILAEGVFCNKIIATWIVPPGDIYFLPY